MCRLLGVVTRAPFPLSTALGDLAAPFTELSREHGDGWGVATLPGQDGAGPRAVGDDLWDRALAGTPADAPVLHLRMASPGLGSEVSLRRGPDFFRLRYRADGERVIVASSGVPQPDGAWRVLPYRRVPEVRRDDLRVRVHA
jgi:hypothetical protein